MPTSFIPAMLRTTRHLLKVSLVTLLVAGSQPAALFSGEGYRPLRERSNGHRSGGPRPSSLFDDDIERPARPLPVERDGRYEEPLESNAPWNRNDDSRSPREYRGPRRDRFQNAGDAFGSGSDLEGTPSRRRAREEFDDWEPEPRQPRIRQEVLPGRRPENVSDDPAWMGHLAPAQELISRRYRDASVLTFLGSVQPQQMLQLYGETLDLIAERHLSPPAPAKIVKRGLFNLVEALQNPDFLQTQRLQLDAARFQQIEELLVSQFQQSRVTSNADAIQSLEMTMRSVQQALGLSPQVVGLEFVFGAIESLDQFSAFVPPQTSRLHNASLNQNVVGIGVQIEQNGQGLRILRVLPNGPAAQAGLQASDVLIAVDGQALAGLDLQRATALITGPEGTPVTITVARAGGATAAVVVPRRRVDVQTVVDVQMLDPQTGYLKLESFAAGSARELELALKSLGQRGMQSMVLDLRGNPGGLLSTAIEIGRMFVSGGTIVSTRGRTEDDNQVESGNPGAVWNVPLVLLVDEDSASASEILAAAIQENGRGLIVGHTTYGKGTVQTLFPLKTLGASVRLTTAMFYSPAGREMAGVGVSPDVEVNAARQSQVQIGIDPVIAQAVGVVHGQVPELNRQRTGRVPPRRAGGRGPGEQVRLR